jgi:DNA-binding NarL/FixJ family response regulator
MAYNVRKEDDITTPLNSKEVEILTLVAKGTANKEIGAILRMSDGAVKKHISNILRKLNANDRAHAVILAIRAGLISVRPNLSIGRRSGDILVEASGPIRIDSN